MTLETLGEARRLADKAGSPVCAVLLGQGVAELSAPLAHYGADRVLVLEHPLLWDQRTALPFFAHVHGEDLQKEIRLCDLESLGVRAQDVGRRVDQAHWTRADETTDQEDVYP